MIGELKVVGCRGDEREGVVGYLCRHGMMSYASCVLMYVLCIHRMKHFKVRSNLIDHFFLNMMLFRSLTGLRLHSGSNYSSQPSISG